MADKSKGKLKALAKAQEAEAPQKMGNGITMFVGDDTGLLKKLSVSLSQVDEVISAPTVRRQRKAASLLSTEALEEALVNEEVKEDLKDEAVIRKKSVVEFELTGKSGSQVKMRACSTSSGACRVLRVTTCPTSAENRTCFRSTTATLTPSGSRNSTSSVGP